MAIETKNLVLYKSERLSDTEDGGGKYSGQMIEDGQSNNLFNDVSELDRTMGDVSLRKLFPAVTTNDTDLLMGATVFISENPKDPNVSALLFSTKSWIDERKSAQNRIENY
ncbi:curculin-like (Mannose-binding) lectin domain protein, partial [Acinetobacter sp. 1294596]